MYQFYNAHPKGLIVGDCVKRAITVAAQMDYMEVQRELNRYKKVTGARSFNSDYNPHKYVENVLHGRKLSFPAKRGERRMTAAKFSETHPCGRYILNMAGHWSCCVDGVIYDTWDCGEKCVYTAYHIVPANEPVVPTKYFTFKSDTKTGLTTFTIVDTTANSKRIEKVSNSMIGGYIKCLEDFGYEKR